MARLSDIGEKKAVHDLIGLIGADASLGLGDDAALLDLGNRYLVASTDLLSQRTHFPTIMTPHQMGWMTAAVNLSDIAAMGASPLALLVAMGLPRDLEMEIVMELTQGVLDCCEWGSARYVGGDTKEASEIVLTGTALGLVRKDAVLRRNGARAGDLVAVTGHLGLAALGLAQIDEDDFEPKARKVLLEPMPKVKEGAILSASGVVTSCMDLSDGLALSLHELAQMSQVGMRIELDKLPIDPLAKKIGGERKAEDWGLYQGGDYQLLFTLKENEQDRLRDMLGAKFTVIGRAVRQKGVMVVQGQMEKDLAKRGYEHFRG